MMHDTKKGRFPGAPFSLKAGSLLVYNDFVFSAQKVFPAAGRME
jgi:hypothetical protein